MLKLILLGLAVWIVLTLLKNRRQVTRAAPPGEKSANMVRCEVCGVHLPEHEAIRSQRLHYCCEAHSLQRKPE